MINGDFPKRGFIMFHPGQVLSVFSSKNGDVVSANKEVQVMLQMWDDNLLTILVDPKLVDKINEGDIVLVDYRPMFDQGPLAPRMIVTKILRGDRGSKTWDRYREFYRKRKKMAGPNAMVPPPQSYIG